MLILGQPNLQQCPLARWRLLVVLLISGLLAACTGTEQGAVESGANISVSDVLADPARYRLEDAEGGDLLVVIGSAEQQRAADIGQELVVTGQVRQFNLEEIGGELELDLDAGIFAGWSNRAVIMAETVEGA